MSRVSIGAVASRVNAARIDVIGPAGNVQVSCVRAQTPFQPSKSEPSSGFAVSVIGLPKPKLAVQTVPQSSFDAVTRPLPLPLLRSLNSTLIVGGEPRNPRSPSSRAPTQVG